MGKGHTESHEENKGMYRSEAKSSRWETYAKRCAILSLYGGFKIIQKVPRKNKNC